MNFKFIFLLLCLPFLINAQTICANEQWTPHSQELLHSLTNDIKETLSLLARQESKQGRSIENFQYRLELAEVNKVDLGLVVELNKRQSALTVISVTPSGLAAAHGLTVDDEIVSVGTLQVSTGSENVILQRLQQLELGEDLKFRVNRSGVRQEIVIPVTARFMPGINLEIGPGFANQATTTADEKIAATACGEVSVLEPLPINGELFPATFNLIDADSDSKKQTNIQLPVGRHSINVYEQIDGDGLKLRVDRGQTAKVIEINVRADTHYHLGAKLVDKNSQETASGAYWEAVIWKTSRQQCQL
jgi:hypothetical protein